MHGVARSYVRSQTLHLCHMRRFPGNIYATAIAVHAEKSPRHWQRSARSSVQCVRKTQNASSSRMQLSKKHFPDCAESTAQCLIWRSCRRLQEPRTQSTLQFNLDHPISPPLKIHSRRKLSHSCTEIRARRSLGTSDVQSAKSTQNLPSIRTTSATLFASICTALHQCCRIHLCYCIESINKIVRKLKKRETRECPFPFCRKRVDRVIMNAAPWPPRNVEKEIKECVICKAKEEARKAEDKKNKNKDSGKTEAGKAVERKQKDRGSSSRTKEEACKTAGDRQKVKSSTSKAAGSAPKPKNPTCSAAHGNT